MTRSIGTYNTKDCRFAVPPITFADEVVKNLAPPILPSQLHPFLNAEISSHFGKDKDVERGRIFEKAFVYAVYARYLLAHWETKEQWIPFTKVFDGAIDAAQLAVIADYEVNFSKGVVEVQGNKFYDDAKSLFLTYLGGSSHHDAYIWCRTKSNKKEFAVPLQLRHGLQKDKKALTKQLRKYPATMDKSKIPAQKRASFDDPAPLLLSVNQKARKPKVGYEKTIMMIDAGAMSSISWLWLVAPDKEMA